VLGIRSTLSPRSLAASPDAAKASCGKLPARPGSIDRDDDDRCDRGKDKHGWFGGYDRDKCDRDDHDRDKDRCKYKWGRR
jgi:hypothetical protein